MNEHNDKKRIDENNMNRIIIHKLKFFIKYTYW